jgi:hypothetical protein
MEVRSETGRSIEMLSIFSFGITTLLVAYRERKERERVSEKGEK